MYTCGTHALSSSPRWIACITHTRAQWRRKRKERKENSVNIKCLQASRRAGGWRLLSEAICYAPAVLLFSHLSSYVSIPPFFPYPTLSLVSQREVSTSAICFCVRVRAWPRMYACTSLSVRVGVRVYPCVWVWVIRLSCSITVSTRPPYAVFCCLSRLNTMSLHN